MTTGGPHRTTRPESWTSWTEPAGLEQRTVESAPHTRIITNTFHEHLLTPVSNRHVQSSTQLATREAPPLTKDTAALTDCNETDSDGSGNDTARHVADVKPSRGFRCYVCGCVQGSRVMMRAVSSGQFVWTAGLPPLVKVSVLLYDSRVVPPLVGEVCKPC